MDEWLAIRERVARRFHTGSTEAFDLLAQIGRDCVGALQILPEHAVPAGVHTVQATPLSEAEVATVLRGAMAPAPLGLGHDDEDFRISIAGAQEKTALLSIDRQWCQPHGATATTHIFKLPLGESVENEWLCSLILKAYGLPVATCEPLQFEDLKVLSVERFDRAWWRSPNGENRLIRLPQEDIDGHAKNFRLFLRPAGQYQLTPLYDVLSAYPVLDDGPGKLSPFKARMAMAVRSKNVHWKMRDIQRRHWLAVGERHGVLTPDGRPAQFVIDDLIDRTPRVVQAVRDMLPKDFPGMLADSILGGLQDAADKLSRTGE